MAEIGRPRGRPSPQTARGAGPTLRPSICARPPTSPFVFVRASTAAFLFTNYARGSRHLNRRGPGVALEEGHHARVHAVRRVLVAGSLVEEHRLALRYAWDLEDTRGSQERFTRKAQQRTFAFASASVSSHGPSEGVGTCGQRLEVRVCLGVGKQPGPLRGRGHLKGRRRGGLRTPREHNWTNREGEREVETEPHAASTLAWD